MKVWITRDALIFGIEEVDGKLDGSDDWLAVGYLYYCKGDWHSSKEDALIKAEKMREEKIRSFEKQIARLKAMKFE
jgi:hypothetical protein